VLQGVKDEVDKFLIDIVEVDCQEGGRVCKGHMRELRLRTQRRQSGFDIIGEKGHIVYQFLHDYVFCVGIPLILNCCKTARMEERLLLRRDNAEIASLVL